MNTHLTNINYISVVKNTGNEWSLLYKDIDLDEAPSRAILRVQSAEVCGIFVNDEFVEATTGRSAERVVCVEITSRLHVGKNRLALKVGPKYFQRMANWERSLRGNWFSIVAAELLLQTSAGEQQIVTDESWQCEAEDEKPTATVSYQVTRAEYDRLWKQAYLWSEALPTAAPVALLETVGEEYETYRLQGTAKMAKPEKVLENTARDMDGGWLLSWEGQEVQPALLFDFGRLEVGYLRLKYRAEADATLDLAFDYSEHMRDFHPELVDPNAKDDFTSTAPWSQMCFEKLKMTVTLKKGETVYLNIHRRAAHYIQVALAQNSPSVWIESVEVCRCLAPAHTHGWFHCENDRLNEMWEIGKYTLQVNKHQEYESCPRQEMRYFSGDGTMDAFIDYYTFGDWKMIDTSLSLHYEEGGAGLTDNEFFNKNVGLWDFRAWRILSAYYNYFYTANNDFLKRHYAELTVVLGWLIQRMNNNNLIYQIPSRDTLGFDTGGEWTDSPYRLGEKPHLNALLYKSLLCMAELGEIMGDERVSYWRELADKVKKAINERLWSEKEQAYVDTFNTSYIPQDGNALAVLFGIAEGERAKAALETLKNRNWSPYGSGIFSTDCDDQRHAHQFNPMFCGFEIEARFRFGDSADAMDLIHRFWGGQMDKGAKTFWEYVPDSATDRWSGTAHAWGGACAYLLSAFVLGVRPAAPGYERLLFAPCGECEDIRGVVPTVKGPVGVRGEKKGDVWQYTIALPEGLEMDTKLPDGAELIVKRY